MVSYKFFIAMLLIKLNSFAITFNENDLYYNELNETYNFIKKFVQENKDKQF